jgi:hypothetical protein
MEEKELLRKLGEETIYTAKGHFKACDLRRKWITYTIWLCALLNVLGLIGIDPKVDRWLSGLGLFGTIALLIWNEGEGKDYRYKHKEIAEKYLALHKKIRSCFLLNAPNKTEVEELNQTVLQLDQSTKPDIPGLARKLAKKAIEKKDPEIDPWFKK